MRRSRAAWFLGLSLLTGCLGLPAPESSGARPHEVAPDFTLPRTGKEPGKATLAELTKDSALVLVFYRGHW